MCVLKMIMLRLPPEHPLGTYIHKNTFIHVLDITHASHRGGIFHPLGEAKKSGKKCLISISYTCNLSCSNQIKNSIIKRHLLF